VLEAGSAIDDFYNNCGLIITSNTGVGQARYITDYTGSSKTCTVGTWITTPDNTSTYVIVPADAAGLTAAQVNAEMIDVLTIDTYAQPAQGTPPATLSIKDMFAWVYKSWRNKSTQTSTAYKLYNDDASTVDHKATCSDDATTFTRGEVTSGP
jgi:hypothetical protein